MFLRNLLGLFYQRCIRADESKSWPRPTANWQWHQLLHRLRPNEIEENCICTRDNFETIAKLFDMPPPTLRRRIPPGSARFRCRCRFATCAMLPNSLAGNALYRYRSRDREMATDGKQADGPWESQLTWLAVLMQFSWLLTAGRGQIPGSGWKTWGWVISRQLQASTGFHRLPPTTTGLVHRQFLAHFSQMKLELELELLLKLKPKPKLLPKEKPFWAFCPRLPLPLPCLHFRSMCPWALAII